MFVSDGTFYGDDLPGLIYGLYFKNINWENTAKPFVFSGFSNDNAIENITFDRCAVGGKKITGTGDAVFEVNAFAKDIQFK